MNADTRDPKDSKYEMPQKDQEQEPSVDQQEAPEKSDEQKQSYKFDQKNPDQRPVDDTIAARCFH